MKKSFSHDELIQIYYEHLLQKYPADTYFIKKEYAFGEIKGEIDLWRIGFDESVFRTHHIYEFKKHRKKETKALRQLNRFKFAIPFNHPGLLSVRYYFARPINSYLVVSEYKRGKLSELEKIVLK